MRHPERHISEVTLLLDDSKHDGARVETVVLNKEKGGERRVRLIQPDGKELVRRETGPIFGESFNELVKAIEENEFYSKKDLQRSSFNGADLTTITVVSDEGTHTLIANHHDPQVQNIMTAIDRAASQITWRDDIP